MDIVNTRVQFPAEGKRARHRNRKSDEVANERYEEEDEVDIKPGQDELLAARLRDLQVGD